MTGRRWNPLLPLAVKARDEVAEENDGKVSVQLIRERLMLDPWPIMNAFNVSIGAKRLTDQAIRSSLTDWPAYKILGGYEHVSKEEPIPVEELEKILALREEMLLADARATQDIRNQLAQAVLREQLEKGVAATELVEQEDGARS